MLIKNVGKVDSKTGDLLLQVARSSLLCYVHRHELYQPALELLPESLTQSGSSFVTLRNKGTLRGCIGSTGAIYPLVIDVSRNAAAAAHDPRFAQVLPVEVGDINLEVSILQPPLSFPYENDRDLMQRLLPGVHGVILAWQHCKGLLLPQVWTRLPHPADFLRALCYKAGIPEAALGDVPPTVVVYTFLVDSFKEDGYDANN